MSDPGPQEGISRHYKVVELTEVGEREIEEALNAWAAKGYAFESVHFVTQTGSRRPTMAFLFFAQRDGGGA